MKKLAQALQFISIVYKGRLSLLTAVQKKSKKNTKTFRTKKNPYGEVLEDVLKSKKSGKSIKQQLDEMLNEATTSERINVTNRNVSIINGVVYLDGKIVKSDNDSSKTINITLEGSAASLKIDHCTQCTVTGGAGMVEVTSGDIKVGNDVSGSVRSNSGDIEVKGNVYEYIQTNSGDVTVNGSLKGKVTTNSGDIYKTN